MKIFSRGLFQEEEKKTVDLDQGKRLLSKTVSHPLFIAAAVVGAAVCAQQAYRYVRPKGRRPKWKSRSRHPQISRWESEGGDVPQVEALVVSRLEH